MANFWQALAINGTPVQGGIPFVSNTLDIGIDPLNLFFQEATDRLFLGTAGDYSGLGRFNFYGRADAYQPQSQQTAGLGSLTTSAYSGRSSRGTGVAPALSVTGDFITKFNALGYTGAVPGFAEIAAINMYTAGVNASNLGGRIAIATKADNGVITEWWNFLQTGALSPVVDNTVDIGSTNVGIRRLYTASTISVTVGAQTINTMSGRFVAAAAATSVVITNSQVTANSLVMAWPAQNDATGRVTAVVSSAGSFTVHLTAPTANMAINFVVFSRDI